jgi:hypothetical protein
MKTPISQTIGLSLVFVLMVSSAAAARQDVTRAWVTAGAAGTLDETSTALARFGSNGAVAVMDSARFPATLTIRYNIVAVDGLWEDTTSSEGLPLCLNVRHRDNGPDARVVLRVRQVNLTDGTMTTTAAFDSDTTFVADDYRHNLVCSRALAFDFYRNAYFVEAQLSRRTAAGNPGLQIISIRRDFQ